MKLSKKNTLLGFVLFIFILLLVLLLSFLIADRNLSPEEVQITNVTDTGATVTWYTQEQTISKIYLRKKTPDSWSNLPILSKLGKEVYYDDRDLEQSTDPDIDYEDLWQVKDDGNTKRHTHHVTLRGLEPETEYEIKIGGVIKTIHIDKDGNSLPTVTTGKILEDLKTPDPAYGEIDDLPEEANDNLIFAEIVKQKSELEGDYESTNGSIASTVLTDSSTYSFDLNPLTTGLQDDIDCILRLTILTSENEQKRVHYKIDKYKPLPTIQLSVLSNVSNSLDNRLFSIAEAQEDCGDGYGPGDLMHWTCGAHNRENDPWLGESGNCNICYQVDLENPENSRAKRLNCGPCPEEVAQDSNSDTEDNPDEGLIEDTDLDSLGEVCDGDGIAVGEAGKFPCSSYHKIGERWNGSSGNCNYCAPGRLGTRLHCGLCTTSELNSLMDVSSNPSSTETTEDPLPDETDLTEADLYIEGIAFPRVGNQSCPEGFELCQCSYCVESSYLAQNFSVEYSSNTNACYKFCFENPSASNYVAPVTECSVNIPNQGDESEPIDFTINETTIFELSENQKKTYAESIGENPDKIGNCILIRLPSYPSVGGGIPECNVTRIACDIQIECDESDESCTELDEILINPGIEYNQTHNIPVDYCFVGNTDQYKRLDIIDPFCVFNSTGEGEGTWGMYIVQGSTNGVCDLKLIGEEENTYIEGEENSTSYSLDHYDGQRNYTLGFDCIGYTPFSSTGITGPNTYSTSELCRLNGYDYNIPIDARHICIFTANKGFGEYQIFEVVNLGNGTCNPINGSEKYGAFNTQIIEDLWDCYGYDGELEGEPPDDISLISRVFAQDNSTTNFEVTESGKYMTYYGDNFEQPIAEFAINLDGADKAEIRLFADTNGNGVKDRDEKVFDDYTQLKLQKNSSVATYNLEVGWNLITFPLISNQGISTASELVNHFNDQGANIKHIAQYTDAGFVMYTRRENEQEFSNDFNLVPGQGYFVLNYSNANVELTGNKFDEAVPFRVRNGWNLVGVYTNEASYTAEELLRDMVEAEIQADVVSMFDSGLYTSVVYEDNLLYGNNYNLIERKGYFIRVQSGGGSDVKFTPSP